MLPKIIKQPSVKTLKKVALLRTNKPIKHFGILGSLFPKMSGVTHWEEIECLGYNPELSRIEAIIKIKNSTGYSGGMCGKGSAEFIRFFIDYHDGTGFHDLGVESFRAFDISEAPSGLQHPISYMVSKDIDVSAKKRLCNSEVIVTFRAVLSWNQLPSNDPNIVPVYGSVMDAKAVLKPRVFNLPVFPLPFPFPNFPIPNFPYPIKPEFKDHFGKLPVKEIKTFDVHDFIKNNLAEDVSPGRTVDQLLMMSDTTIGGNAVPPIPSLSEIDFSGYDFDLGDILIDPNIEIFNNNYEEVVSVGLNTHQDILGAVIKIKRPSGFSGNICTNGSREYISFFADFNNNGTFERYLGTTSVKVNDIQNIPAEGLMYAVTLQTDLTKYLKKCHKPQVIKIRAILSWGTPPDVTNPEQSVTWGSRMDTLVQLRSKFSAKQTALIYSIGNVSVDNISPVSCLAYPETILFNNPGNNRPWGGMITIRGGMDNSGAPGTTKYRVEYSKDGINYFPVTLQQSITTIDFSMPDDPFTTHHLADANGWLPYLAHHSDSQLVEIKGQVLASWSSHAFEGKYYIRVSYTKDDPILSPGSIQHTTPIRIQLDNKRFHADHTPNNILDSIYDLDMSIDGGVCKVYKQGATFTGKVKVRDAFYGGYDLSIQPATQVINNAGLINYLGSTRRRNSNVAEMGPLADKFKIDTGKLKKCGYTLRLRGYERVILNNSHHLQVADKYIGFSVQ